MPHFHPCGLYHFKVLARKRPLCEKAALSLASRSPPVGPSEFLCLLSFRVLVFAQLINYGLGARIRETALITRLRLNKVKISFSGAQLRISVWYRVRGLSLTCSRRH